jgi:Ca2+/Na+ antiporter
VEDPFAWVAFLLGGMTGIYLLSRVFWFLFKRRFAGNGRAIALASVGAATGFFCVVLFFTSATHDAWFNGLMVYLLAGFLIYGIDRFRSHRKALEEAAEEPPEAKAGHPVGYDQNLDMTTPGRVNWGRGVNRLLAVASVVLVPVVATSIYDNTSAQWGRAWLVALFVVPAIWIARFAVAWIIRGFQSQTARRREP